MSELCMSPSESLVLARTRVCVTPPVDHCFDPALLIFKKPPRRPRIVNRNIQRLRKGFTIKPESLLSLRRRGEITLGIVNLSRRSMMAT